MFEPSKIEEVRQKHPGSELHLIRIAGEELVVRSPSAASWERFTAKRGDSATRFVACKQLIIDCAGIPTGPDLIALLDRRPGLVDSISAKLAELAGATQEAEAEKL